MYIIPPYLKKVMRRLFAATVCLLVMQSCDSVIYDDEGDCSVTYRVAFRYDLNMKWADAFANEVKSVHLYAFDSEGVLVWQGADRGDALAAPGYTMTLPLGPGSYRLVAWGGLDNGLGDAESFSVPALREGVSRIDELQCRLRRDYIDHEPTSNKKLAPLFHGILDVTLPDISTEGGDYTCTMPLTKNTNHVRIILQHLSGEPVDPADFTFTIEEENGLMAHDNRLLPDELITYRPHSLKSGSVGMNPDDYPVLGNTSGTSGAAAPETTGNINVAIADMTIARLTTGRRTYLTVRNAQGATSARIPLADYALLLKDGYDRDMTDSEYLDRQDDWSLTFFLDERDHWAGVTIIINSWRLVLKDVSFGDD